MPKKPTPKRQIVVSHAAADSAAVDLLVETILELGIGIRKESIFYSSGSSSKQTIPAGEDFRSYIRTRIQHAPLIITVLSPNFNQSAFCLAEMGATWVLESKLFPVVLPPHDYSELKAVFDGLQAIKLGDEDDLDKMCTELQAALEIEADNLRWKKKRKEFLRRLPAIAAKLQSTRRSVPIAEHNKVVEENKAMEQSYDTLSEEHDRLKEQYAELEKRKDAKAVRAVRRKFSSEDDQFELLVKDAEKAIEAHEKRMREVFFHDRIGKTFVPDEYGWDGYEKLQQRKILRTVDNDRGHTVGYELNHDHPTVRPVITALNALSKWLERSSPEFHSAYLDSHQHDADLSNRDFWAEHFGL